MIARFQEPDCLNSHIFGSNESERRGGGGGDGVESGGKMGIWKDRPSLYCAKGGIVVVVYSLCRSIY